MLIEDNPDDTELIKRAFEKSNIMNELLTFGNGEDALAYLFRPDLREEELPQVILLDLKLPKIDGLEVLKRIRNNEKTGLLPVVILTSSREERDLAAGYRLGANSYIQKPVDFDRFAEAVNDLGLYWLVLNIPAPNRKTEKN